MDAFEQADRSTRKEKLVTEQDKTEMTTEQAIQEIAAIKGSLTVLIEAAADLGKAVTAQNRIEAREIKRLDLMERDVEQCLRIREEQHEIWKQDVAHNQAYRERIEEIARDQAKSMASIAESLGTIAKTILEEAKS
jgi:hypothetical protein